MNLTHNDSVRVDDFKGKKLKAFTLVELIIVMAIIAVLSSIVALVVPGFVRDYNLQAYNADARMMYTGMQDCLIQWEIKQNNIYLDAYDQVGSGKKITYAVVELSLTNGNVDGDLKITPTYDGTTVATKTLNGTTDVSRYNALCTVLNSSLGSGMNGRYYIYIDYGNYTVDSVMMTPNSKDECKYLSSMMHNWTTKTKTSQKFAGCINSTEQRTYYKNQSVRFGCYPFLDAIGVS